MQGENGDQQRDDLSIPPLRSWASHAVSQYDSRSDIMHSPDMASSQSGSSTAMRRRELTSRDSNESITYIIPGTQSAFVTKLYNIVGDEDIQHLISWSKEGDVFSVKNPTEFARTILPQYFKHNNWQSFVRQLNMYGFHKVNDVFHTLTNEQQLWEFAHECFRRGQPELLQKIKRKTGARLSPAQPVKSDSPSEPTDATDDRIRQLEQQIIHLQAKCETIIKINSDMRQTQLQQQEMIEHLQSRMKDDVNGDTKSKRKIHELDRLDRARQPENYSPRASTSIGGASTTSQPQSPYSSYDAEDTRKSSWSTPRHERASVEPSPRTMSPSLLRNSSRSDYSSLQPINNPYSTYSSEYPGGTAGESNDRSMENVERFRLLPPILGPEKKSSRPSSAYSDNDQRPPPQHHRPRSSPMIEASSSNRDQEATQRGMIILKK
ncbi:unnamed protein product [Umbelopsis ramanniana]